jgi:hypothetical protein
MPSQAFYNVYVVALVVVLRTLKLSRTLAVTRLKFSKSSNQIQPCSKVAVPEDDCLSGEET